MTIRKYNPTIHRLQVSAWLLQRDLPQEPCHNLPEYGAIVPGVAAGFLRLCEGNHAILDSFISNPNASPEDRDKAIDLITEKLLSLSHTLKIKQLTVFSRDLNTIMRAQRFGFDKCPHQVLTLSL